MDTHWSQLPGTIIETLTILWDSSYYCVMTFIFTRTEAYLYINRSRNYQVGFFKLQSTLTFKKINLCWLIFHDFLAQSQLFSFCLWKWLLIIQYILKKENKSTKNILVISVNIFRLSSLSIQTKLRTQLGYITLIGTYFLEGKDKKITKL